MKRIIILLIIIINFNLIINKKYINGKCENSYSDKIRCFLKEYIDNKPSGRIYYIELFIYGTSEKNQWEINQAEMALDDDTIILSLYYDKYEEKKENFDYSSFKILKWKPHKELVARYTPEKGIFVLKMFARKKQNKKNKWEIYCKGRYKITKNDKVHIWELKSIEEVNIKGITIKHLNR